MLTAAVKRNMCAAGVKKKRTRVKKEKKEKKEQREKKCSSSSSCPCGGSPRPSDKTSSTPCKNVKSYLDGIRGKSVSQCHNVVIRDRDPTGIPRCKLNSDYDSADDQPLIHTHHDGYTAYHIFSPGYSFGHCYSNKLFCCYHVQCLPNQFLYYHFSHHDIEDPSSPSDQCLDILTITRDSMPNEVLSTCGRVGVTGDYSSHGIIRDGYEAQRLRVHFRSNKKCSTFGYHLYAFCMNTTEQTSANQTDSNCVDPSDLINRQTNFRTSNESCTVPLNGILEYNGSTVTVNVEGEIQHTVLNVKLLKVKAVEARMRTAVKTYQNLTHTETFYGEGKLTYQCVGEGNCTALYIMTGVPQSYRLTPDETEIVRNLLSTTFDLPEGEDYNITGGNNSSLEQTPFNILTTRQTKPEISPHLASLKSPVVTVEQPKRLTKEQLIDLAYRSSNSCKAVMRSVGNYYIQQYSNQQVTTKPEQPDAIRKS